MTGTRAVRAARPARRRSAAAEEPAERGEAASPANNQASTRTVTIRNQRGLHARAAAKFVKLAGGFEADITLSKGGQTVSGLSIMGLMMLAAGPESRIDLRASGPQAEEALEALCHMIEGKFEED